MRNLMSGSGFEGGAYSAQWLSAWFGLGIIILILFLCFIFIVKGEMSPYPFSFPVALLGFVVCAVIISFGLPIKLGFILGVLTLFGGGFGLARFLQ